MHFERSVLINHLTFWETELKKYKEAITTIQEQPQMTVENHTRKQVQMHAVARNLTARFAAKVPTEFGFQLWKSVLL